MKLKGKALNLFEDYFKETYTGNFVWCSLQLFYLFPLAFQYGVYLKFFDSVKIHMSISPIENDNNDQMFQVYEGFDNHIISCETRSEAMDLLIRKAKSIING